MGPTGTERGDDPGDLLAAVYDELRAIARVRLAGERPDHTLQATALVHEAYLRLVDVDREHWNDESHFQAAIAGTLRRVLVDHARARGTGKRGGGWKRVTLSGLDGRSDEGALDVLALDEALERLTELDARVARVVELRYFGGLTIEQTARALDVGVTAVKDRWEFARAWLRRELGGDD